MRSSLSFKEKTAVYLRLVCMIALSESRTSTRFSRKVNYCTKVLFLIGVFTQYPYVKLGNNCIIQSSVSHDYILENEIHHVQFQQYERNFERNFLSPRKKTWISIFALSSLILEHYWLWHKHGYLHCYYSFYHCNQSYKSIRSLSIVKSHIFNILKGKLFL